MERSVKAKKSCGRGEVRIDRKAYTRKDGTRVGKTSYCAEDQGSPGVVSRGAKQGPNRNKKKWITREGKLGGPGYTKKTAAQRHKILDACVKEYGYRSCLGSITVLLVDSEISAGVRKKLTADKNYLERKYGGPGSFGPRKNPSEPCCDACAIGNPCESGCDTHEHGHAMQPKLQNPSRQKNFAPTDPRLIEVSDLYMAGLNREAIRALDQIPYDELSEADQLDYDTLYWNMHRAIPLVGNPPNVKALKNKLLR